MLLRYHPNNFPEHNKNGNLLTWPGLNNQQLLENLPPSIATELVHMDQECKKLQSTKQVKPDLDIEEDKEFYPCIETFMTH